MLLFFSISGVFLSVLLIYFGAKKFASSIFLGLFFLTISLYAFIVYTLIYSNSEKLVAIVFVHFGFLTYLTGPFLYGYIRSVLRDETKIKTIDLVHFAPMLIFVGLSIPYYLKPWSYKMEIAHLMALDFNNVIHVNFSPLYIEPWKRIIFLSRPLLTLAYTFWSLYLFVKFISNTKVNGVFIQQTFMKKWVLLLLTSTILLTFSQLIMVSVSSYNQNIFLYQTTNLLQVISGVSLACLMVSPFFFPQILYGLPLIPENNQLDDLKEELTSLPLQAIGNTMPKFEEEYLQDIQTKIERCMVALQPYLQRECNLAYISKLTNIPAHHLSYYFKEIRNQAFTDYKNEYRVVHAKNLIKAGKHNELTLEGVGLISGFSSRNTFFRTFKKYCGVTPGEFAQQS
jgi:AraC-like DNA-binding protein